MFQFFAYALYDAGEDEKAPVQIKNLLQAGGFVSDCYNRRTRGNGYTTGRCSFRRNLQSVSRNCNGDRNHATSIEARNSVCSL